MKTARTHHGEWSHNLSSQQSKIESHIDAAFIERAEDQIYQILLTQRLAFNQRWFQHVSMNKVKTALRFFGLFVCLAGVAVMTLSLTMDPTWRFTQWQVYGLLVFFILAAWFFIKLPTLDSRAKNWAEKMSQKSCRKLAKKCVKQAKSLLPFNAQYEIKGDSISYYRNQQITTDDNQQWHFVWNRKMSRFAVQAACATIFFKQSKSIQPKMIVLHEQADELKNIMDQFKVKVNVMLSE